MGWSEGLVSVIIVSIYGPNGAWTCSTSTHSLLVADPEAKGPGQVAHSVRDLGREGRQTAHEGDMRQPAIPAGTWSKRPPGKQGASVDISQEESNHRAL